MVALQVSPVRSQFEVFSIPGDIDWSEAQQPPFNPVNFFQSVDYSFVESGIAPLDTVQFVSVPDLNTVERMEDLSKDQVRALDLFSRHVVRDSVFAMQDVAIDGETVVHLGDLLLAAKADFPNTLTEVQILKSAGVDSVRAMVNLAHAVLWPRDPQRRFETLLRSPTIYERVLNIRQLRDNLERMIDNDPSTGFVRVDRPNRPVEKRAVVIRMNVVSRFPVGMVRFYPRPLDDPIPISAFKLEVNDGVTVKRGQEIEVRAVFGSNYEVLGTQAVASEKGIPVYELLGLEQSNVVDTVAYVLDPPKTLQHFQFRSLTGLDFDIAEFEVFNQGFPPVATYLSRPLPVDKSAMADVLSYQEGDRSKRSVLDRLGGSTLGRIYWDEEKVGDPSRSRAVVSFQTGLTPEPLILWRLSANGDVVEWRPDAQVIDQREGSITYGETINLDDPKLRAGARDIWNVLTPLERAAAQTTFAEYTKLTLAQRQDRSSFDLPRDPDAANWSGYQEVTNGQLITVPGERPFFQIRVIFVSSDYDAATVIKNLRFEQVLPPLLTEVTAEIVPAVGVRAGEDTSFTYALRPSLEADNEGFNRVRLSTPTRSDVEQVEFGFGDLSSLSRSDRVEFGIEARGDSFLVVSVPHVDAVTARDDSLVLLLHFRGRVLDAKSTFTGHVFLDTFDTSIQRDYGDVVTLMADNGEGKMDTLTQILPQRVRVGNVLSFGEGQGDRNSIDVVTSVSDVIADVIVRMQVEPNPFTPNDDGVNDVLGIAYDVLRVVENVPVSVEIFDLSGRIIRNWTAMRKVAAVEETWDGRDNSGKMAVPGLYLIKVSADTDERDFAATRFVALAY